MIQSEGYTQYAVSHSGERSNAAGAYLHPVVSRPNFDVVVNTRAIRLRSTGIEDGLPVIRAVDVVHGNYCKHSWYAYAYHASTDLVFVLQPQLSGQKRRSSSLQALYPPLSSSFFQALGTVQSSPRLVLKPSSSFLMSGKISRTIHLLVPTGRLIRPILAMTSGVTPRYSTSCSISGVSRGQDRSPRRQGRRLDGSGFPPMRASSKP